MIEVGQKAPAFTLPQEDGGTVSLSNYAGKRLVLYFYPKDDTSGCTKQAVAFSDHLDTFRSANTEILGISRDTPQKHAKFREKHDLTVPLASDEDGEVLGRYGVWVEKNMYGRTYMGIERSTFLIDEDGVIRDIWRKVRVPGHVDEVLEAVRGLG